MWRRIRLGVGKIEQYRAARIYKYCQGPRRLEKRELWIMHIQGSHRFTMQLTDLIPTEQCLSGPSAPSKYFETARVVERTCACLSDP